MLLNDALQTIGLLCGIAGVVLVAGPTPLQRAAGSMKLLREMRLVENR